MARYIGVRHRCKRTREGEARPTTVAIRDGDRTMVYELENDTAELDFLMCRWPISWRKVKDEDEIQYYDEATKQGVRIRHCKLRRVEEGEDLTPLHPTHVLQVPDLESGKINIMKVVTHVPVTYEGLQSGDVVGMVLGGSGKNFASALSRRGEEVGAQVYRLPPFTLADKRGEASKNDDHLLLARLVEYEQSLFYLVRLSDRDMIRTAEALFLKISAMKSRIACGQRLAQRMVGRIFLSEEGRYPEGVIEDLAAAELATDEIYVGNINEEKRYEKELEKAVKKVALWEAVFADIKGCGPRLAAGLIVPIGDIRRFWVEPERMEALYQHSRALERQGDYELARLMVAAPIMEGASRCETLELVARWQEANGKAAQAACLRQASQCHKERGKLLSRGKAKLRKYCGVHVNSHDKHGQPLPRQLQFPRRRAGEVFNSSGTARQTVWLLGEQFNRRPDSYWGKKLLDCKQRLREKHPAVVEEEVVELLNGGKRKVMKKRFTPGHILKMAKWRVGSKFVDFLFAEWTRIEEEAERQRRAAENGSGMAVV